MNWYLKVIKQYADFKGRASRQEYWMFVLFNLIFASTAMILDNILGIAMREVGYGPLYILYVLAVFIPGLAVSVRRLHDVGKSGWTMFIALIPIIGGIWLLVIMATEGDKEENQYDSAPKVIPDNESESVITNPMGDKIIMIVVIWILSDRLLKYLAYSLFSSDGFFYLSMVFSLLSMFVPIALAFAVRDKSKQILLFVLGGIYLSWELYDIFLYW